MDRKKHYELLTEGVVSAWNRWRMENPGVEIDLQGVNLRIAKMLGADLRGADLRGADLQGADLQGADLQGANLRGADLQRANLRGASLLEANLQGASLEEANLRRTNLYKAKLREADLKGATYNNETIWPGRFTPPGDAILVDDDAPPEEQPEQGPQPEPAPQPAPSPTPGASRVTKQFVTARITYIRQEISSAQAQLKAVNDNFLAITPNEPPHAEFHNGVMECVRTVGSIFETWQERLTDIENAKTPLEQRIAELERENADLRRQLDEVKKKLHPFRDAYWKSLAVRLADATIIVGAGGVATVATALFGVDVIDVIIDNAPRFK